MSVVHVLSLAQKIAPRHVFFDACLCVVVGVVVRKKLHCSCMSVPVNSHNCRGLAESKCSACQFFSSTDRKAVRQSLRTPRA